MRDYHKIRILVLNPNIIDDNSFSDTFFIKKLRNAWQYFLTLIKSGNRRQFTKTIEALERYYNKKLRFYGDFKSLYQNLILPVLVGPPVITSTEAKNPAKLSMW